MYYILPIPNVMLDQTNDERNSNGKTAQSQRRPIEMDSVRGISDEELVNLRQLDWLPIRDQEREPAQENFLRPTGDRARKFGFFRVSGQF